MGRRKAVATTGPITWSGMPAWMLARTYHLAMMPGAGRRARLLVDWNIGLLFGRDTAELGRIGAPRGLGGGARRRGRRERQRGEPRQAARERRRRRAGRARDAARCARR